MTPERHERIGELFHAALELDPSERTEFLRRACAGDDDLCQHVSSLIKLEQTADDFIEVPVWQTYSEPLPALPEDSNGPGGDKGGGGGNIKHCPRCLRRYPGRERVCPEDNQRLSLPDPYRLVGRILADKYRIEALVGIGGMGAVYNAYHLGIHRPVAFKILQPNVAISNDRMLDLFEREARVVGNLYHENIADIKDAGRASDGIAYIVMEWLDGCTLDEELAASGPFAMERVAGIFRQISAALEAAHAKQIVHCDLKPSNIMLTPGLNPGPAGREMVKVLDFGIAKILTDPAGSLVSAAMGTPHYASPEQLQVGRTVDARSDIYSLGVILFQMLTGKLPFQAGSVRELINRQMEAPARISELRSETPIAIQRIVNQMLAIDPAGRPQSVSAVAAIVNQAMRDRIETQSVAHGARFRASMDPFSRVGRVGRDGRVGRAGSVYRKAQAGWPRGGMRGLAGQFRVGRRNRPRPVGMRHGRARDRQDDGRRRFSRSCVRRRPKPPHRARAMLGTAGGNGCLFAAPRSDGGADSQPEWTGARGH